MAEEKTEIVCSEIDARQSRLTVQAFAEGLLSSFGHNPTIAVREFNGKVCMQPGNFESSTLELVINPSSMSVTDNVSEKDRREIERAAREDVLETGRFGEISYRSTGVSSQKIFEGMYRVTVDGELTLHGVSRPQRVEAQVTMSGNILRARGEVKLKQSDFNIKRVSVAGGTLRVKDEVKVMFEMAGRGP